MIISNLISRDNIEKLHIKEGQVCDIKYNPRMEEYINYYNDVIYIGNAK